MTEGDAYRALMDLPLEVEAAEGLTANDRDPDGDPLTAEARSVETAAGGAVEIGAAGGFTYVPPDGWWGEDSFTYEIADLDGERAEGSVRIVVAPTTIPLDAIAAGRGGFAIDAENTADSAGAAVSGAGDVDGDGLDDVLIGAPRHEVDDAVWGRTYVVFGTDDTERIRLSDVASGTHGFMIDPVSEARGSGRAVGGGGDVDGDGLADVIVGAQSEGASHVIFGKSSGETVALTKIGAGVGGFRIDGAYSLGGVVDVLGDVNGDALSDLLVAAAPGSPGGGLSGWVHVVFGKNDGSSVDVSDLPLGAGGFSIDAGAEGPFPEFASGVPASGAGDVNGDSLTDIVRGGSLPDVPSCVVFGRAASEPVTLSDLMMGVGGFCIGDELELGKWAGSVAGGGDLNRDGFADVALSYGKDIYVVFGKNDGDPVLLADIEVGDGGFKITRFGNRDLLQVAFAGDVNGDGFDDVLVGAAEPVGSSGHPPTRAYVVFGKADGDPVDLDDIAGGTGGFALSTEAPTRTIAVDGAGDVNGDGFDDIILGAPGDSDSPLPGRSYVIFGGDFTLASAG